VRVGKVNTDDNPKTASSYSISAIPTVLLFKGGAIVDRFVGVVNKDKLTSSLNTQLG
jgi:thioredoxin 1